MLKTFATAIAAALVAAGTISCTTRSAATGASSAQSQLDERPRANSAGRAAGAGGSHAPGSTGSGHGTFGADSTAEMGSVR
ncbi:MAG: hypothetical protein ACT4P4_25850 [Betaproteobacteria bacterium]